MKVVGVFCALLVFTAIDASSQFHASGLHVHGNGNMHGVYIYSPPGLTGDITLTLPTSTGTLLVNQGAGVSNAWLLGGNDLTSAPADNKIGSSSAHDAQLIANGQERLTLLSGSNAIATGQGTELRLVEPAGTEYTSFRAQAQTANIVYTLPASLPTVGQVLEASAVSGSDVTTAWVTPSGGGGGGNSHTIVRSTANVGSADETNYTTISDMNVTLDANTNYVIDGMFITDNSSGNHNMDVQIVYPSGTATIVVTRVDSDQNSEDFEIDQASPVSFVDLSTDNNQRLFRINGVIYVGGTGGTLEFQFRRNADGNGTDQSRIMTGSYWSVAK
ncbi:MAG TPA: hypothetical protein VK147_06900 [Candidatus Didemnitutus sp.]|nr:hypothetical protein [Candidatus Didemnitutus sp.]